MTGAETPLLLNSTSFHLDIHYTYSLAKASYRIAHVFTAQSLSAGIMAEPTSITGADGIRSLKDDDAVFRAFDSYPWTKDKTFMVRLAQITTNF